MMRLFGRALLPLVGLPGVRHHRRRRAAAELVTDQRRQPGSRGGFLTCRSGETQPARARTDATVGAQSGSTWTFISMNSSPCPRIVARRRRRARACSRAVAAAAAISASGVFFLAPEPAPDRMGEPRPTPGGPTR